MTINEKRIIVTFSALLMIYFLALTYGLINYRISTNKFYSTEFCGRIEKAEMGVKGDYTIIVNQEEYFLGIYASCIGRLYPGDSIIKDSNSFKITIYRHYENDKMYTYSCFKEKNK